jgi:hypothetical protein
MSFNRATLNDQGQPFLFEDEKAEFSFYNVGVEYQNGGGYPGQGESFESDNGSLILTNIRLLYYPTSKGYLKSLTIPLQNIQDGKLNNNFFSGSSFTAAVKSVFYF